MTREEVLEGLDYLISPDCTETQLDYIEAIETAISMLNPMPVKPIKTCETLSTVGVDGILIIGECPECHQRWLNNRDNKFCGGCGVPIDWSKS